MSSAHLDLHASACVTSKPVMSKESPTDEAEKSIVPSVGYWDVGKSAWRITVKINVPVSAVVDTAAKITIVAQTIYNMSHRPEIISSNYVILAGGGETTTVDALDRRDPRQAPRLSCAITG